MRKFFLTIELAPEIRNALRSKSARDERTTARPELSLTHYRLLLSVDDPAARAWYMHEAAESRWSTRQLERQISVLYYERLLASRKKAPVRRESHAKLASAERTMQRTLPDEFDALTHAPPPRSARPPRAPTFAPPASVGPTDHGP